MIVPIKSPAERMCVCVYIYITCIRTFQFDVHHLNVQNFDEILIDLDSIWKITNVLKIILRTSITRHLQSIQRGSKEHTTWVCLVRFAAVSWAMQDFSTSLFMLGLYSGPWGVRKTTAIASG